MGESREEKGGRMRTHESERGKLEVMKVAKNQDYF